MSRSTTAAKQFKVIMIGDSMVGKTSIIQRFIDETFVDNNGTSPTLAWDFKVKTMPIPEISSTGEESKSQLEQVRLYVWDTAGQERFRHIARMYYKDICGVLLCFDLTDEDSFKNLNFWLTDLQKHAPEKVCKMLLGNKADLCTTDQVRKVPYDVAAQYALDNGMQYFEVSAKTNENINEAFLQLTIDINRTQSQQMDMLLGMDEQLSLSEGQGRRISDRMGQKRKLKQMKKDGKKKKGGKCC
ncbi:hypothetical protein FGO68_gene9052 [Halteria grandinella]|uniref:Uncharacterized protein n=1 Tax=Halteria grandinella TaxID=5974 RepID=A0A8J8NJZ1_HALGN|nr:hypothetical protein FGO68_gene9052 [Halteria grandinella]